MSGIPDSNGGELVVGAELSQDPSRPTVKRVTKRVNSRPGIPYKSAGKRVRDEKVTELRVMIANVSFEGTLPPGPRLTSRIIKKVTKSDRITGKVDHFLDGKGRLPRRFTWVLARVRFPGCQNVSRARDRSQDHPLDRFCHIPLKSGPAFTRKSDGIKAQK